ncbi:MAG TPA: hypothetical protein VFF54_07255 [Thermodesulfobacteriota bacterium]|nr:hypothetical protein [Thermodesulfobacteriota bacterium]
MRFIHFIIAIFLLVISPVKILAWDTVVGHSNITLSALDKADHLDRFLGDFGLTGEIFNSQDSRDFGPHSAKGWIFWGSIWEDYGPDHNSVGFSSPNNRFFNHYFDPISGSGLTLPGVSGQVSRDWGKGIQVNTDPDTPTNEYDWQDARTYFYNALTGATDIERKTNFSLTFRSLGQVVHLLEDASQPGHVRNDPHVSPSDDILGSMIFNSSRLEEWANNNGSLISSYAASAGDAKAYPAFDNYFNGLASFTNTNFLSDDTIFKNYSMPSEEQTGIVYDAVEDGDGIWRIENF